MFFQIKYSRIAGSYKVKTTFLAKEIKTLLSN
ncbi:Uncharacterised protein [Sphingobacterium daejeonense]|nr:Uncharacterised protein [Sphingobacterium daejeonense]